MSPFAAMATNENRIALKGRLDFVNEREVFYAGSVPPPK
jgi:hypothetical protein